MVGAGPVECGLYSEDLGGVWSRLALEAGGGRGPSFRTVVPQRWPLSQEHQCTPETPGGSPVVQSPPAGNADAAQVRTGTWWGAGLAQAEVWGAQSTGSLSLHTQADSARVEWCTLGAPC